MRCRTESCKEGEQVDVIFIMRQIQENMVEGNNKLDCAFIDLEKASYRISREVGYWCLRMKDVSEKFVRLVM